MPMIPSVLAGAVLATVKVVGYAAFSVGLNRIAARPASPLAFGTVKTALGLVGGVTYVLVVMQSPRLAGAGTLPFFLGAAPLRLAAWALALGLFYRRRVSPRTFLAAIVLGGAWSYALDGMMWVLYDTLPGMEAPWC